MIHRPVSCSRKS
ncbi:hypothetical protein F383_38789 [Gossypium arboreum]|uniref:Uncharacterized protein n=1 Tax=Gossypium arboreum TaxID=29729 RepID=A0A0B0MD99_GOSAR|nr:hypothetical protein F383_38789 [Gossypium arboreum]